MKTLNLTVQLPDEESTVLFGSDLAAALRPGDLVALNGDLGVGKSALARSAIRSLRGDPTLEVPSPTYSLVQFYEGTPPVAHLDLYRLESAAELDELGITELLQQGIVLIEWAERFAGDLPAPALEVRLADDGGRGRVAQIAAAGEFAVRFERSMHIRAFLDANGRRGAWRRPLAGDASARIYELVSVGQETPCLLMDAPAQSDGPPLDGTRPYSRIVHLAEDVTPFVAVAGALRAAGFSAPEIHAADLDRGILLVEHLGNGRMLDNAGRAVPERYLAAADLLACLHKRNWPRKVVGQFGVRHALPDYDREAMLAEVDLLLQWYLPAIRGREPDSHERSEHGEIWNEVLDQLGGERSIVLRDFHSPNLIWRADRTGLDRIGLIDFQDAVIGPTAYDLASLAQDARVTIPEPLEREIVAAYCAGRGRSADFFEEALLRDFAIMAAQRNAKILGIFIRLDRRDGKPAYLRHLPRIRDYMRRALRHETLAPLLGLYSRWGLLDERDAA